MALGPQEHDLIIQQILMRTDHVLGAVWGARDIVRNKNRQKFLPLGSLIFFEQDRETEEKEKQQQKQKEKQKKQKEEEEEEKEEGEGGECPLKQEPST